MTRSLYSKFILGYLIFGLLGFITIATFSSRMTRDYLMRGGRRLFMMRQMILQPPAVRCTTESGRIWLPFPPS